MFGYIEGPGCLVPGPFIFRIFISLLLVGRIKKHISIFLLAVFSLVVIPAPFLHELFADHQDAADNHCRYYHKDLGRHVEQQENHCDIFKADTPIYDALKIEHDLTRTLTLVSVYISGTVSSFLFSLTPHLPARAPPIA